MERAEVAWLQGDAQNKKAEKESWARTVRKGTFGISLQVEVMQKGNRVGGT